VDAARERLRAFASHVQRPVVAAIESGAVGDEPADRVRALRADVVGDVFVAKPAAGEQRVERMLLG
jgi:hypothetical protein